MNFIKNKLKTILPAWSIEKYRYALSFYKKVRDSGKVLGNINTKKYWNKKLSAYNNFWRDESYHCFEKFLPPDELFSLLDIGCGLGDGTERLKRIFPKAKIYGADFSRVGIEKAKKRRSRVEYLLLDIENDPIPATYDYILIVETLEHLSNPFEVVDKCLKYTRKSLWISVPLADNASGRRPGKTVNVGEHVFDFNKESFSNYQARITLIDVINDGLMPRIVFEIKPPANNK